MALNSSMNDKDWLDKVLIAYNVYSKTYPTGTVTDFVEWLYKQYGIQLPKNDK